METSIGPVLAELVEALEDSRHGYSRAADEVAQEGHHEIANQLREFSSQRARFSSQVRDAAVAHGSLIRQRGSRAGALHRRWLSIREAFSAHPVASVLSAADRGERHTREVYERALAAALPDEIRAVVERQAGEVASAGERIRAMQESAPA